MKMNRLVKMALFIALALLPLGIVMAQELKFDGFEGLPKPPGGVWPAWVSKTLEWYQFVTAWMVPVMAVGYVASNKILKFTDFIIDKSLKTRTDSDDKWVMAIVSSRPWLVLAYIMEFLHVTLPMPEDVVARRDALIGNKP